MARTEFDGERRHPLVINASEIPALSRALAMEELGEEESYYPTRTVSMGVTQTLVEITAYADGSVRYNARGISITFKDDLSALQQLRDEINDVLDWVEGL